MALELNSDIAVELNITARKNDTFQMKCSVEGSDGIPLNLAGTQVSSPSSSENGLITVYQGKMTIKKAGTNFESLNVYSYWWKDSTTNNVLPTLSRTGHWSGSKVGTQHNGSQFYNEAGIWFKSSSGLAGDVIYVTIPGAYMSIDAGEYEYDLQTRKKAFYTAASSDDSASYSTWLYGKFTVIEDVTKQ